MMSSECNLMFITSKKEKAPSFLHLSLVLMFHSALSGARRRPRSCSASLLVWNNNGGPLEWVWVLEIVNKLQHASQTCAKALLCFHGNQINS